MNINRRDKENEAGGYYRDNEPTLPSWGQVLLPEQWPAWIAQRLRLR